MHTISKLALCTLLSIGATACGKKSNDGEGSSAPDRFTKVATATLAGLDNLKIDIAEGQDTSMTGGSIMIISMDESFTVGHASSSSPATLDAAKKKAEEVDKGTGLKSETLADGWLLTYQSTGSLGESFHLQMRREIAGKAYSCATAVGYETLRDGATVACKSLRP